MTFVLHTYLEQELFEKVAPYWITRIQSDNEHPGRSQSTKKKQKQKPTGFVAPVLSGDRHYVDIWKAVDETLGQ